MILPKFAKNCMKLRKFWAVGGARRARPPKSATARVCHSVHREARVAERGGVRGRGTCMAGG